MFYFVLFVRIRVKLTVSLCLPGVLTACFHGNKAKFYATEKLYYWSLTWRFKNGLRLRLVWNRVYAAAAAQLSWGRKHVLLLLVDGKMLRKTFKVPVWSTSNKNLMVKIYRSPLFVVCQPLARVCGQQECAGDSLDHITDTRGGDKLSAAQRSWLNITRLQNHLLMKTWRRRPSLPAEHRAESRKSRAELLSARFMWLFP